jgi:ligand-binding sensor domain-containing protein/signal transduction histidine kinase
MNILGACRDSFRPIAVALLIAAALRAQAATHAAEPGFIGRIWDSQHGLAVGPLNAMARTRDGYLWIGSDSGLVRFDGARFVTLTTNTVPALGDNRISSLLADTNGALWVATKGGTIAVRQHQAFSPVAVESRLRGVMINSLKPAASGGLWLATQGQGLVRFQAGRCDFSVPTNGLRGGDVTALVREEAGKLWVVSGTSLMTLERGRWEIVPVGPGATPPTYAASVGRDGTAWLATAAENLLRDRGGRVLRFAEGGTFEDLAPYAWPQDSQRTSLRSVLEDRQGRVWVGTVGAGVYYWTEGRGWTHLAAPAPLSDMPVSVIMQDEEGSIWLAGSSGALNQLIVRSVGSLRLSTRDESLSASCACAGPDDKVWVGTEDTGVLRFAHGVRTQFTNGLADLHVRAVLVDRETNLWVGTLNGLYRWEDTGFKEVVMPVEPGSCAVSVLFEDRQTNLWAGTSRGLVRRSPNGESVLFGESAGLDHFLFRSLAEDVQGRLWLAVEERGLYRQSGERFEMIGSDSWSAAGMIRDLRFDPDGGLWITTEGAGLFRFAEGNFRQWSRAEGLPETTLHGIVEDDDGNLWFGSEDGILGCSKTELMANSATRPWPLLFWHLTVADGLESRACLGSGQPGAAQLANGLVCFPNKRSVAIFNPLEISRAGQPLVPVAEEVTADGLRCPPGPAGTLRLRSGARHIEFHYTCPDLRSPEQLRFRYRLEGCDADWTEAGSRRLACYGQLAPGKYDFRVMAGGAVGKWREAACPLSLIIVPRLWERWSVRVAGVLALLGGASATVWTLGRVRLRRRLARLEAQQATERERRRIAQDLHDGLSGGITELLQIGDLTLDPAPGPEALRSRMETMIHHARKLGVEMDEIVWTVNPRNDTLVNVAGYVTNHAQEFLSHSPIRCRLDVPANLPDVPVDASTRHNLFLAVKEALHNVAKHSGASEVWVRLHYVNEGLRLSIEDNGRGFDPAAVAGGDGLTNMRERMEAVKGKVEFVSRVGGGMNVTFALSLPGIPDPAANPH